MSLVNILDVQVLDNPAPFRNPFQFEITFECIAALEEDLEWRIIYVGSAESEEHDQVLDNIMVGPVPVGVNKFVFQAPAPQIEKIPSTDAIGVTVVLLTCSYLNHEFVRVGYYVNNEYMDEQLKENPPTEVQWDRIARSILSDKPRVTRFPIAWTKEGEQLELPVVEGNPDEEPAELDLAVQDVDMDMMNDDDDTGDDYEAGDDQDEDLGEEDLGEDDEDDDDDDDEEEDDEEDDGEEEEGDDQSGERALDAQQYSAQNQMQADSMMQDGNEVTQIQVSSTMSV
ncbi:hypothetical protein MIR68_011883 [Amoeboaphelidium protococcarum]|nr:hypothetical protein MIR68_011883 [Amoeboaphelidium protococcarum]